MDKPPTIYTIGHSTHGLPVFTAMLTSFGVEMFVDVRAFPRSRATPQFNQDTLAPALRESGIEYRHMAALGGRRPKAKFQTDNVLWRNASFRNYADYATTPEFHAGLQELLALAADKTCAIMCAEAVWWRCHRRIIADYLIAAGCPVLHIMAEGKAEEAELTKGAVIASPRLVSYRGDQGILALDA